MAGKTADSMAAKRAEQTAVSWVEPRAGMKAEKMADSMAAKRVG